MAQSDAPVLCGRHSITWRDVYDAARTITRDEGRLGRDIVASVRPRIIQTWTFEFGRSRVIHERQWASERMWGLLVEMAQVQHSQKKQGNTKLAADKFPPLLLARDAAVSEEKDRIYGILEFKEISAKVTIEPDFNLSLRSIYLNFSAKILATGDLNILQLVSRESGFISPSWAVEKLPPSLNHSWFNTPIVGLLMNSV